MLIKPFNIDKNGLCPCRSGKKYKDCCEEKIKTSIKDKSFKFYQAGQYHQALLAYRAWLTQYIIWYNEHTVPFVKDKPAEADDILRIDIDALIEIIQGVASCLNKLDKTGEIDAFLGRCTNIVDDERFRFCILGARAAWFLAKENENMAKRIMLSAKGLDSTKIVSVYYGRLYLNLFLDLCWVELPLGENLHIIHDLSSKVDDPLREVYQLTRKAMIYFLYLDGESAISTIDEAINKLNNLRDRDESTLVAGASVYYAKAIICKDTDALIKACDLFKELLAIHKECELVSAINHSLGQLYNNLGDYMLSNNHLQIAISSIDSPSVGLIIDYAKSFIMVDKMNDAKELLKTIKTDEMEDLFKIDYYYLLSQIALRENDRELAQQILLKLDVVNSYPPIFKEMISNIRISLLEMLSSKEESRHFLQNVRDSMSKYLLLQPNFFGFGININEIIKPKKNN
jgi:tetratricopeptide (TPR) repeat protein